MAYKPQVLPFRYRTLPDETMLAVADSGDHAFFAHDEFERFRSAPESLSLTRQADLQARFLLGDGVDSPGKRRLLASRIAAKRETVTSPPSLHIIVTTLQCAHSCRYCQVSRSLTDEGFSISVQDLDAACDTILESDSDTLTVEFQGGDPLLRFDLIERAILRITAKDSTRARRVRFVIASTLHQLTPEMCEFFKRYGVFLSTSLDGPRELHNRNRPTRERDSYERTMVGIHLARTLIGHDSVSALMTTTKASLLHPEAIVDEYVERGFKEIFLRPLSSYGFAKRNQILLGYTPQEFHAFYLRGLERVLHWNRKGVPLREVYASILLNKILSPFDNGYVDLQSPSAAGSSVLVYNYDGYVYPSDEARMLLESGDASFRQGKIGTSLNELLHAPVRRHLVNASLVEDNPECSKCAYKLFCAPNPVDAQAQHGSLFAPAHTTEHCQRHLALFDAMFSMLKSADDWLTDLFHEWARPIDEGQERHA